MKRKIAKLAELQAISCKENGERLVPLAGVQSEYRRRDSGLQSVLVRETVLVKLQAIQDKLPPELQLLMVEGYRRFSYQEEYYLRELLTQREANPALEWNLLLEKTHQFVALPSVSGHPTGGAIDLTLAYCGKEVDMGGEIADFSQPHLLPTYSSAASEQQAKWRILLHDRMIAEGFAPFYGEWWHFSYGDREWAAFYDKAEAIYSPIFD